LGLQTSLKRGNNIPGYSGAGYISLGDEPQCPDSDAPMLKFFFAHGLWQVHGRNLQVDSDLLISLMNG
jgi:hypothetical protein